MEKKCSIGGVFLTANSIFSHRSVVLLSLPSSIHCDCCLPSLFNRTKLDLFVSISQDVPESLIVRADYSALLSIFPIIRSLCVFTPIYSDSSPSFLWLPPLHFSVSHFSIQLAVVDSQNKIQMIMSLDSLKCSIVNSSLDSLSLLTSIQYNSSLIVSILLFVNIQSISIQSHHIHIAETTISILPDTLSLLLRFVSLFSLLPSSPHLYHCKHQQFSFSRLKKTEIASISVSSSILPIPVTIDMPSFTINYASLLSLSLKDVTLENQVLRIQQFNLMANSSSVLQCSPTKFLFQPFYLHLSLLGV